MVCGAYPLCIVLPVDAASVFAKVNSATSANDDSMSGTSANSDTTLMSMAEQLMRAGRQSEAVAPLERVVALVPNGATAYQWLGSIRAVDWEKTLKTRQTDFSIKDPIEKPELRAQAVSALEHSLSIIPTANPIRKATLHSVVGNLMAPNGRSRSIADAHAAISHFERALSLIAHIDQAERRTKVGALDAAKRLAFQRHMLNCQLSPPSVEAEVDPSGGSTSLTDPMEEVCAAYTRWSNLLPSHSEARALVHFDCTGRKLRKSPRQLPARVATPAPPMHAADLRVSWKAPEEAARVWSRSGVVVFERVLPSALCDRIATELLRNGTDLRNKNPDTTFTRWNNGVRPTAGAVGEAVGQMSVWLGDFVAAALGAPTDQLQLLDCTSTVIFPAAEEESWGSVADQDLACEATAMVLELQLSDATPALAPTEFRPMEPVEEGDDHTVPRDLPAGSVIAYNARVIKRSGANRGEIGRPTLQTTWMALDDGLAPRGLLYNLPPDELGRWTLDGIAERVREGH